MKLKFLTILFLFFLTTVNAQREAANWYFGSGAGLDFNSGTPVVLTNGRLDTQEGCATMSDINGNLLFYTDGSIVYNRNHSIMPNGSGLLGHSSSTQSAIIVPNPTNNSIYYIFTVDEPNPRNADSNPLNDKDDGVIDGLNYSEINMNLDNNFGDINPRKKNIPLITYNSNNSEENAFKCSEKITAIQHADGNSFWVITFFNNTFYSFRITSHGVNNNPVKSTVSTKIPIGGYLINAIGYLKSSPNGKKLAIANMSNRPTRERNPKTNLIVRNTGKVLLYDFNNETGKVSNENLLISGDNPYGVEFSSQSKKLYVTVNHFEPTSDNVAGSSLYQFDLKASNISKSKKLIIKNNNAAGALQLAIDGKIYRAGFTSSNRNYLSVINLPEKNGTACDFSYNKIYLKGKIVNLGLPPFIQSLFLFNFKYEFTCFGDTTHFFLTSLEPFDSLTWDFGDGVFSKDKDAYHEYKSPGTYTVSLTKTIGGVMQEPLTKQVVIKNKPNISTNTFEFVACDSYDNNPNDGLATFNLENSINDLTLNKPEDYLVYFYLNENDAETDVFNQNSLPLVYTSVTPDQQIIAKIRYIDSDCYSLGKIKLTAVTSSLLTTDDMVGCELENNLAEFHLNDKTSEIISSLNLPSTIKISYFETIEDASNETNPLNEDYISSEKTIYFKASNNGVCYGSGNFNLKINYFPLEPFEETLNICENNFPITIKAPIPIDKKDDYNYQWSNGSTSYSISRETQEIISVTITDKLYSCQKQITYTIKKVTSPNLNNIDVNINNNTILIHVSEDNENLYALDNAYGNYQMAYLFTNVQPGTHTIYAKNKFNCGISSRKVFLLGFPKFFTPNNDGLNDEWGIKGLDFQNFTFSKVDIFNRFGKHIATIAPNSNWNGFYNGRSLESTDYWFSIEITDSNNLSKTYKGHFSLIRK